MNRIATLALSLTLILSLGCGGSDDESAGDGSSATSQGSDSRDTSSPTAAPETQADVVSNPDDPGIDPCSLLTVADLEAATELTWGPAEFNESQSSEVQSVCDWVATSEFAIAQVLVMGTDEWFDLNRDNAESVFGLTADPPSIPGVDELYATEEGSLIAMRIGGRFVQVSYIPPGPGNVLSETTELATAVADRS